MRTQLLCTFTTQFNLEQTIMDITKHFSVIFEVMFWVCFLTQFGDRFRTKNINFIICLKCRPCVSYGKNHMFDKFYLVMSCLVLLSCLVVCGQKVCRKVTKKKIKNKTKIRQDTDMAGHDKR